MSPDGNYRWDGTKWVAIVPHPAPSAANRGGTLQRQFSPDGRFWWDGQRWLPYKRINWNSVQLRTNPPEDEAILSRNLGVWCIVFGTISLLIGGISILAVIGGIAAIVHWAGFRRSNAQIQGALPGKDKATVGLVLAAIGLAELLVSLGLRLT